ncbi:Putative nucleoporin NDC1 [Trichuris trichiura]|uniref:Putative nucleoporin NDC1 n=1 Tax=Trichuris trichiura TaxID=36087 RepID=A0A077YX74_TRITR|nr:Putative nucleoporin NDC1 [Trichuris trichiura]
MEPPKCKESEKAKEEEDDGYCGEETIKYYYDGVYHVSDLAEFSDTVGFYRRKAFKRVLPWAVLTNGMVFGIQLFGFALLWRLLVALMLTDPDIIHDIFKFRTLWCYAIVMVLSVFFCCITLVNFRGSFRMRPSSLKSLPLDDLDPYLWGFLLEAFCSILIGILFFSHTAPSIPIDTDVLCYVSMLSSIILMLAAFMSAHYHVDFSIDYSVADLFVVSNRFESDPCTSRLWLHIALYDKKSSILKHLAFAKLARVALNSGDCNAILLNGRWGPNWSVWNSVREACLKEMSNFEQGLDREHDSLYSRALSSTQIIRRQYQFPSAVLDSSFDSWSTPMKNYHQYVDFSDTDGIELGKDKSVYDWNIWNNYQIVVWCAQILCGAICVSHSVSSSNDIRPYLAEILSHFFSVVRRLRKHQRLLLEIAANSYCKTSILNLGTTVYWKTVARLREMKNTYGRSLGLFIRQEEDARLFETM